jgi:hypothetical protein
LTDIRYSYAGVPTIRAFSQSDAFVRGLMGPFGSGKSSGCVFELIRRAQRQVPGPDGVRRTRWAVVRNCYDDQTEILTENRGWQLFANLNDGEPVATLRDGALSFERPTFYYRAPYLGEMVGCESDSLNFLVTPDHKLYTSKRQTRQKVWSEFGLEKASDAFGKTLRRFKRDAKWSGWTTPPWGEVGPYAAWNTEKFFEFFGFWFAEGYAFTGPRTDCEGTHYRLVVTQAKYLAYTRDLLKACGFTWGEVAKESGFNFVISIATEEVKQLVKLLVQYGKSAPTKFLPHWIRNAPPAQLQAFLHGFLMGDGHIAQDSSEATRAYTSSKQLADDLQEIALKAGWVANLACYPVRERREGTLSFQSNFPQYVVTFLTKSRHSPHAAGWFRQQYEGMVYCIEVPTHVVYVRRGGKAFWCSQTYRQLTDTTVKTVDQWLPPGQFGDFRQVDMQYVVRAIPECEIEILYRALDRPDHVANLLSFELTGAWVNEAREVAKPIFDALQGRVGRFPPIREGGPTWSGVFADTNPPDTDSWWYKLFEDWPQTPEGAETLTAYKASNGRPFVEIFKQPSGLAANAENLSNLPNGRGYYETLAVGKDREWVKVYVGGEYGFVIDGRPVFPEYNDALHCSDKVTVQRGEPIYRGWDFGLTPACVFAQLNSFGQFVVLDELTSESMSIDVFADEVLGHCARNWSKAKLGWEPEWQDVGDPAGMQRVQTDAKTCFQILGSKGIFAEAGEQTLTIRLESVRRPLTTIRGKAKDGTIRPGFLLHPRCKALRKGFLGGYQFRRLNTSRERYTEKPDKNEASHPQDALQYIATVLFGAALTAEAPRKKRPGVLEDDFFDEPIGLNDKNPTTGY